jgi:hypothetical protein
LQPYLVIAYGVNDFSTCQQIDLLDSLRIAPDSVIDCEDIWGSFHAPSFYRIANRIAMASNANFLFSPSK